MPTTSTKAFALATLRQAVKALDTDDPASRHRLLVVAEALVPALQSAALAGALRASKGNLVHAAADLGIPTRTASRWLARDPAVAEEAAALRG